MLCSRFDSTKLVGLNQRLPGAKTIRKPNDGKQYRRDYVGVRGSPVRRPGVGTENLSRMSDPTRIGRPERTLMGHHNVRARAGSRQSCARRISVCRSNVCAVAAPTHVLATIPSSSFAARLYSISCRTTTKLLGRAQSAWLDGVCFSRRSRVI